MTSMVPDEFVRLSAPWNITNDNRRMKLIKTRSEDAEVFVYGLEVFVLCLKYRVRTYPFSKFEEHGVFNEHYMEARGFTKPSFTEWMPTFADVTLENTLSWLQENPDILQFIFQPVIPELTLELAEEISKDRVPSMLRRYGDLLYYWLDESIRNPRYAPLKENYLYVIKDYVPRVDPRMADKLIGSVWSLDEHKYDYLRTIVNSESLNLETRESAQYYLDFETI